MKMGNGGKSEPHNNLKHRCPLTRQPSTNLRSPCVHISTARLGSFLKPVERREAVLRPRLPGLPGDISGGFSGV